MVIKLCITPIDFLRTGLDALKASGYSLSSCLRRATSGCRRNPDKCELRLTFRDLGLDERG